MSISRTLPALLVLALLLVGCPPALTGGATRPAPPGDESDESDDSEDYEDYEDEEECEEEDWEDWYDDDDTGEDEFEPDLPDPDLPPAADCGRYAWLQGATLTFDDWQEEHVAGPGAGDEWCVSYGDSESWSLDCYWCDAEGVRLVSEYFQGGPWEEETVYYDPPLVWRHDAEPGSSWTVDMASVFVDYEEGTSWQSTGSSTFEVVDEEEITVPALTASTLVVRQTWPGYTDEWWTWVSDGLGVIQDGWSRTDIDRQLVDYELQ